MAEHHRNVARLLQSGSLADQQEAGRLSREVPAEVMREGERLHEEMKAADTFRRRAMLAIFGIEDCPPGAVMSEGQYMFDWLCWLKYDRTTSQLVQENDSGSLRAAKRMQNLRLEYDRWRFGKLDPNKLKFKIDLDHFDLMTAGLNLGMENLATNELADCFDTICPCGKRHFPESLRKLRARILQDFPPTPPPVPGPGPDPATGPGSRRP